MARERVLTLGMRTADGRVEVQSGRQGRRAAGGARRRGAARRGGGRGGDARARRPRPSARRVRRSWRHEHHRGLHPAAGPRLDADGGDRRLRRGRRHAASASASSRTSTSRPSPCRSTWEGAAPEVDRERRRRDPRGGAGPGRGRHARSPRPRARAAPRSPSSSTSTRDVDLALQDVQTKVAQAQRRLPRDIDPPVVSKTNPEDQPIMWVGLSGPYLAADAGRQRALPGARRSCRPSPASARSAWAATSSATSASGSTPPGSTSAASPSRDVIARAAARARRAARRAPRDRGPRGQRARAGRGARPRRPCARSWCARWPARRSTWRTSRWSRTASRTCAACARVNGAAGAGPRLRKQRGANAVAVAQAVQADAGRDPARRCRQGMSSGINFDSTRFIEESVHEIEFELLLAVLLTALVCWMFLGSFSSTLNVVLAIPMSLLGTVAVDLLPRASRSTPSPCWRCRWRSASWSTTRSW